MQNTEISAFCSLKMFYRLIYPLIFLILHSKIINYQSYPDSYRDVNRKS